ncbi:PD40 domain-containing protein [Pseudoalteromonas sp. T1lg23B]|uniref:PD40 domain-containing protein n=1 Tax=Pseudoalteromonas sp. T1lg23B TaxID=2077097 RepID=UPI000CF645C5|nr:PD40 domain-containing protein [Pseudoalteromonas sp. T1lg23B]
MTQYRYFLMLFISLLMVNSEALTASERPLLTGPYLGQTPPGMTPKVFAPGYVSTRHRDHSGSFTPDMQEFYFSRKDVDTQNWWLVQFKQINNVWHESVVGPRIGRPILSPDGNTMYLGSKYMQRTSSGWSEVKSLGPMIDRQDWGIMRLSASANGTYIFDDYKNNDVLRISEVKNGKRQAPVLLGPHINAGKWTAHPFIAQDGSYIIWDSEKDDGFGDKDLYISFRLPTGEWGDAINLGDAINTSGIEAGAYVSPDGNYLFFNRNLLKEGVTQSSSDGDIYWVDAAVIEQLRPKLSMTGYK